MDGGAWWAAVHVVAKSQTRLSDFTFTFHFPALEKEMVTHSSVLAWRIPRMGSLVGCHLWGYTESDMTEVNYQQQQQHTLTKMFKIAESLFINSFPPSFILKSNRTSFQNCHLRIIAILNVQEMFL